MGFALQWHTAHSGPEPIVAATDRPQLMDQLQGDVLVVTCEVTRGDQEDVHAAGVLAHDIVKAYCSTCPDVDDTQSDEEIAQRMVDAITLSVCRVALPAGVDDPFDPTDQAACNILAVAVRGRTLLVARNGNGQVYLLRDAKLQHLTASAADAADPLELGKLELKGEDRVLVCTSAFGDALKPLDLQRILKAQPSSRRTAQALLHAAEQARETQDSRQIGLAVIDFISGKPGAFPIKLEAPLTRTRSVALPLAIVASAVVIAAIVAASATAAPTQNPVSANALLPLVQIATDAPWPVAQSLPAVQAGAGMPVAVPQMVEPDDALPGPRATTTATARPMLPRNPAIDAPFLERRNVSANPPASPTPAASKGESASIALPDDDDAGMTAATAVPQPTSAVQSAPVKRLPRPVLEIEPRMAAITLGEVLLLSAEVRDENGAVVTAGVVTWQPSDMVVGGDARSALFKALIGGTYTVTASLGDLRGQATVVVLIPLEAAGPALSMTAAMTTQAGLPAQPTSPTVAAPTAIVQPVTDPTTPTEQPPALTSVPTPVPTLTLTPVLTQTIVEPTPEG